MRRIINNIRENVMKFILKATCVSFGFMLFVFPLFFLSGCKEEQIDFNETTINIKKSGEIENTILDDFDKDYYNSEELRQMIEKEIAQYQSLTGESGKVKLKSFSVESGRVKAIINYSSFEDYKKCNDTELFVGNYVDAVSNGIDTNVLLVSTDGSKKLKLSDITGQKNTIIVFSEPVCVSTYSDVEYVSANVEIIGNRQVRMSSESVGDAYIVIK